jgi:predicted N-acetyltransferase YhbS
MYEVRVATTSELREVESLYTICGYRGGVDAADTTFLARSEGRLIGAVRICREQGVTVLRGMHVLPSFQRQRVGSQLLAATVPLLDKGAAFCLPYSHLAQFYASASFQTESPDNLPDFLRDRLAGYIARGQDIIAMSRNSPMAKIGVEA